MAYLSNTHSEQSIQDALYKYFGKKKNVNYLMSSIYIYDHRDGKNKKRVKGDKWEDDFFLIDNDTKKTGEHFFFMDPVGFKWSIEIKRDTQDYVRSEKKKVRKHELLKEAFETNNSAKRFLPNVMYYCAPVGMIPVDSLPPYAGLIEVDKDHNLIFVTENRLIHDYIDPASTITDILTRRFYKKSVSDERKFIAFMEDFRKTDPNDAEALRNIIIAYDRRKRLP